MKFNLYYHKSTFENIMIPLLKTLMETVAHSKLAESRGRWEPVPLD